MTITKHGNGLLDWIGLCSVLRPHQHSIGYMGDGFYRSKDPTNSIKVHRQIKHTISKNEHKTQLLEKLSSSSWPPI